MNSDYRSILETNRFGASAKIPGRPRTHRCLAQGANFNSNAPMARGASLGKSLYDGVLHGEHYFAIEGALDGALGGDFDGKHKFAIDCTLSDRLNGTLDDGLDGGLDGAIDG